MNRIRGTGGTNGTGKSGGGWTSNNFYAGWIIQTKGDAAGLDPPIS